MDNEAHQIAGYAGAIYEFYIEKNTNQTYILFMVYGEYQCEWINGNFSGIV